MTSALSHPRLQCWLALALALAACTPAAARQLQQATPEFGTPEYEYWLGVQLPPLNWTDVAAGAEHTCGIRTGLLFCWGHNAAGQLGIGGLQNGTTEPRSVVLAGPWLQVTAGKDFSCAIRQGGEAWCWGSNAFGQLGSGSGVAQSSMPVQVAGGYDWRQLSAGTEHVCGLTQAGLALCWGNGADGRLGDESSTPHVRSVPSPVVGGTQWSEITAGGLHSCALDKSRVAFCWGSNGNGQLGGSNSIVSPRPVAVHGGGAWRSISAGALHNCAVRPNNTGACWGDNSKSQSGSDITNGVPGVQIPYVPIVLSGTWSSLVAGPTYTAGIRASDGQAVWFGLSRNPNIFEPPALPVVFDAMPLAFPYIRLPRPLRYELLAAGEHLCATGGGGSFMACWGDDSWGQLGNSDRDPGVNISVAHVVTETIVTLLEVMPTRWTRLLVGSGCACGLPAQGSTPSSEGFWWCWGSNKDGRLGLDMSPRSPFDANGVELLPRQHLRSSDWADVSLYASICVIKKADGSAWCAGNNVFGQNGHPPSPGSDYDSVLQPIPAPIGPDGPMGWKQLSSKGVFICGITASAASDVYCWGANWYTLGLDYYQTNLSHVPQRIVGTEQSAALAAGTDHACALKRNGTLVCWGRSTFGQLGAGVLGPNANHTEPLEVWYGPWTAVAAGSRHTCGLKGTKAYCWGDNQLGQLGDASTGRGSARQQRAPVAVAGELAFRELALGRVHSCGVTVQGDAWCWGSNEHGQLGIGDAGLAWSSTPRKVAAVPAAKGRRWVSLSLGEEETCGLLDDGTGLCFGWNYFGMFGDGSYDSSSVPTQVGCYPKICVDPWLSQQCPSCWLANVGSASGGSANGGSASGGSASGGSAGTASISGSTTAGGSISSGVAEKAG